jgi:predicted O-methyltransferase YrrM
MQTQNAKKKAGRPKKSEAKPEAKPIKAAKNIVTTATFNEEARHGWNSEADVCQFIGSLIKMNGYKNVLEIGVFEGETSIKMIEALPVGSYYVGIDINDYRKHKLGKPGVAVDFILGESINVLKTMPENHFDFIFVDGDHSWENILPEFKEIERVIRPGGVIAYHDSIHLPDVKKLIEYAHHYKYNTITLNTSEGRGLSLIQR